MDAPGLIRPSPVATQSNEGGGGHGGEGGQGGCGAPGSTQVHAPITQGALARQSEALVQAPRLVQAPGEHRPEGSHWNEAH